ncbi:putative plastid-lipid-associated protein [Helianthus annuus]|nr:putative plastid-lipid-associated protein [Helianthus annuus]
MKDHSPYLINSKCTIPTNYTINEGCNFLTISFDEENEGATLLVSAKFSVVFRRNIFLEFEEIALQNIIISEELQALIAPALLPRSFFSLQILQAIRTFKAQIPVNSTSPGRRSVGGLYYLSYLDKNMLVGRAVGGGGVFVFSRAQNIL